MKSSVSLLAVVAVVLAQSALAQSNVVDLNWSESVTTRFGQMKIKSTDYDGQKLYLNKMPIELGKEGDSFDLTLLNKISRESDDVLVVWGGSGGTMDNDTNIHCKFVTIGSKQQYSVSVLTYCPNSSPVKYESGVISYNFANPLPYAFESDIGKLSFVNGKVKIIQSVKNDKYYRQQYANYTPRQIYDMMSADSSGNAEDMINSVKQNKMWCHSCGSYGIRYCDPFNWIKNPPHDKYYQLLKPLCSKPIY